MELKNLNELKKEFTEKFKELQKSEVKALKNDLMKIQTKIKKRRNLKCQ